MKNNSKTVAQKQLVSKKLNVKKAVLLILAVAIIGGLFVWRSSAAVKLVPYQYSVYQCSGFNKSKIKANDACANASSEAFVFRSYTAIFARNPDQSGYKFWVQKLAGDRVTLRDSIGTMLKKAPKSSAMASKSNTTFVKGLYKNLLKRNPDKKGLEYWKKRLDSRSWSRSRVIEHFVLSNEAKALNQPKFAAYMGSAPKVTVVQVARKNQEQRTKDAQKTNADSRKIISEMKTRSADNTKRKEAAGKISSKSAQQITQGDLNKIKDDIKVIQSRLTGYKGKDYKGKIDSNYKKVATWHNRAAAVTKHSPDITHDGLKLELKTAKSLQAEAQNHVNNAKWLLDETNRALSYAQSKYNNRNTGGGGGSKPPKTPGGGSNPPKTPAPGGQVPCSEVLKDIMKYPDRVWDCM